MPEPLLFLLEPLDVQAASYLAASDNILNFSLISISSFISISDIISLTFEHLFDNIIAHMFEYVNRQLQEFNFTYRTSSWRLIESVSESSCYNKPSCAGI